MGLALVNTVQGHRRSTALFRRPPPASGRASRSALLLDDGTEIYLSTHRLPASQRQLRERRVSIGKTGGENG